MTWMMIDDVSGGESVKGDRETTSKSQTRNETSHLLFRMEQSPPTTTMHVTRKLATPSWAMMMMRKSVCTMDGMEERYKYKMVQEEVSIEDGGGLRITVYSSSR